MSLIRLVKGALFAVGTLMVGAAVVVKKVHDLVVEAKEPARALAHRYTEGFKAFFNAIREANDEMDDLQAKRQRDRRLNEYDQMAFDAARERRMKAFIDLSEARTAQFVDRVAEDDSGFDNLHVTESNLQVVQFHAGQTVSGKACVVCGRPMILQWQRGRSVRSTSDFFWGCSGYYDGRACDRTERFGALDMSLFTKVDRPEFEVQPQALDVLAEKHRPHVEGRVADVIGSENETYCCPIHLEPMQLRRKNNADGLLDLYFFGCPRWRPDGTGCNHVQKLKSAAQLSAVLETSTGRGLL